MKQPRPQNTENRKQKRAALSINIFGLLFLGTTFLFLGCDLEPGPSDPAAVVIGYLPIVAHLPAEVARQDGQFANLDVEFRVYGSSNDLLSAIKNGKVHFATTVAVAPVAREFSIALASNEDYPIRIVSYSKTTSESPFDGLFVSNSSSISSLKGLEGARIAVFPGTTATNILEYFLRSRGVSVDTIEWMGAPPGRQVDLLLSGTVDALFTYETTRTVAELSGARQIHGSVISSVLEGAPYGCSAVNAAFLADYPRAAAAVIEALDAGIRSVRNDESKARRVLEASLGVSPEVSGRCNLEYRFTSSEILEPANLARFDQFLDILHEAKEVPEVFSASRLMLQ